jgi:hypothetical protein
VFTHRSYQIELQSQQTQEQLDQFILLQQSLIEWASSNKANQPHKVLEYFKQYPLLNQLLHVAKTGKTKQTSAILQSTLFKQEALRTYTNLQKQLLSNQSTLAYCNKYIWMTSVLATLTALLGILLLQKQVWQEA